MSSPDRATSETTVLLGDSRSPGQHASRSLAPETLLIPVALATRLATQIPATTLVELVRKAVCRFWLVSHGNPVPLPVDGSSTPESCDAPGLTRHFATVMALAVAIEGLVSIVGCGVLSRISSYYGRKPALLIVLSAGITSDCVIPWSQYMPNPLADRIFFVGVLIGMFSNLLPYAYLANLYIVDVCAPGDRTAALSKIAGWAALGTCISYAVGGFVTTKTGNPLIVFYMAATTFVATFIYIMLFLPESFAVEKRNAISSLHAESSTDDRSAFLYVFKPLKMLMPARRLDGTRNWRLAWCALHTFTFMSADSYAAMAWLVLATSKYHLTPADTGIFLTVAAVSSSLSLMVIVPPLVHFLRPYYWKKSVRPLLAEQGRVDPDELELETSDRLDVHLAFVSCVVAGVSYVGAAASTTNTALVFSAICIGFASIHAPTTRSLVAGSVDPLQQGDALAAIEMASNAGIVLSPIVMGSILTATIGTAPMLMFYVHMIVVVASSALLFLVRDADGYRKPHVA